KYVILMIFLDIAAPILLLVGITKSNASTASLLNNFEIVATSLIAYLIFKENINIRLWYAIILITISSVILSINDISSFTLSFGAILILLACISWGLENNCTKKLSIKDPLQVVIIKGFGSGIGALIIAFIVQETSSNLISILLSLLLGFFAYGLSIFFYVTSQRYLGASETSAYYAVSPFIGVILSFILFKEPLTLSFIIALLIMILGTYLAVNDKPQKS
ncbi:MAG TPA: DMT family transporter, partial [Haloplasmataceae bacterium]